MSALSFGETGWTAYLLQALFRASWQGGLMLVLVWVLSRTCPRIPAWLKVWLWRLAFFKLLLFALPQLQVPLLPADFQEATAIAPHSVDAVPAVAMVSDPTERFIPSAHKQELTLNQILLGFWIFGMSCLALRLAFQWLAAARLRAAAAPISDPRLVQECARLAENLGLRRMPHLLESTTSEGPMLVGITRPAIVLPRNWASNLSPARLRLVLAHELAHFKRRDLPWSWVMGLTQMVFFFHPLVWLCQREWTLVREIAAISIAARGMSRVTLRAPAAFAGIVTARSCGWRSRIVPRRMITGQL